MKVRSSVRKANGCKDCYFTKRKGVLYMLCKVVKRHKTRQG